MGALVWSVVGPLLPWLLAAAGALGFLWKAKRGAFNRGRDQERARLQEGWENHARDVDQAVQDARAGGPSAARDRLLRAAGDDRAGDGGALPRPGDRPPDPR